MAAGGTGLGAPVAGASTQKAKALAATNKKAIGPDAQSGDDTDVDDGEDEDVVMVAPTVDLLAQTLTGSITKKFSIKGKSKKGLLDTLKRKPINSQAAFLTMRLAKFAHGRHSLNSGALRSTLLPRAKLDNDYHNKVATDFGYQGAGVAKHDLVSFSEATAVTLRQKIQIEGSAVLHCLAMDSVNQQMAETGFKAVGQTDARLAEISECLDDKELEHFAPWEKEFVLSNMLKTTMYMDRMNAMVDGTATFYDRAVDNTGTMAMINELMNVIRESADVDTRSAQTKKLKKIQVRCMVNYMLDGPPALLREMANNAGVYAAADADLQPELKALQQRLTKINTDLQKSTSTISRQAAELATAGNQLKFVQSANSVLQGDHDVALHDLHLYQGTYDLPTAAEDLIAGQPPRRFAQHYSTTAPFDYEYQPSIGPPKYDEKGLGPTILNRRDAANGKAPITGHISISWGGVPTNRLDGRHDREGEAEVVHSLYDMGMDALLCARFFDAALAFKQLFPTISIASALFY
jgi:hypothetical protein